MRIFVSGATTTVARMAREHRGKHIGHLVTPQNGNDLQSLLRSGLPWACDNAAFSNPDDRKFWNMSIGVMDWLRFNPPEWITAPDVVCDHAATVDLFFQWRACWECEIGYVPFDLAFVLQNGATVDTIPWDDITAVFVGGDDRFKLRDCWPLVQAARNRGKQVHVGRVNTHRRIKYAFDLQADSVDGTAFSRFGDKKLPRAIKELQHLESAPLLFNVA